MGAPPQEPPPPNSPPIADRLRADMDEARRARDHARTLVLSTTLAEVRNREIEAGGALDAEDVLAVVAKAVKQRREAAAQMRAAGRDELARKEEDQAAVLQAYLPQQLSAGDVRAIAREIVEGGAANLGAVMGRLMPRVRGRFDGKAAAAIAKEELG